MSDPDTIRTAMLVGRIEVLERAMFRVMALAIVRDPDPEGLLEELRSDLRSFVLSLPMIPQGPEGVQHHARQHSDELLRQISDFLQASPDTPNE